MSKNRPLKEIPRFLGDTWFFQTSKSMQEEDVMTDTVGNCIVNYEIKQI